MRRRVQDAQDPSLLVKEFRKNRFVGLHVEIAVFVVQFEECEAASVFCGDSLIRRPVPVRKEDLVTVICIIRNRVADCARSAGCRDRFDKRIRSVISEAGFLHLSSEGRDSRNSRISCDLSIRQIFQHSINFIEADQIPFIIEECAERRIDHIVGAVFCDRL